ncbi:hypothetical protein CA13_72440 [Planctomycetes bacterium CA13]|uniref:Uncharacterized protein n=1 Tax=Novipirellula herctigrandis TaxID=2527986 RepID=A0A5C5YPB6_9BACT|nr:hypothetical protein CA13_72440 [Planctomycetes bacterium CA13]
MLRFSYAALVTIAILSPVSAIAAETTTKVGEKAPTSIVATFVVGPLSKSNVTNAYPALGHRGLRKIAVFTRDGSTPNFRVVELGKRFGPHPESPKWLATSATT